MGHNSPPGTFCKVSPRVIFCFLTTLLRASFCLQLKPHLKNIPIVKEPPTFILEKKKGMDCGCGHIHWLLKPEVLSQILTDKPRAQFRKKKKKVSYVVVSNVCVCVYTVFLYKWIILGKPCFLSRKSSFCSEYSTRKQKHPGSFFHLQFVEDSVSICSSTLNTWVLLGSAKVHIEICKWYI